MYKYPSPVPFRPRIFIVDYTCRCCNNVLLFTIAGTSAYHEEVADEGTWG